MYLDENTLKEIIIAAIQFRGEGISIGDAIKDSAEALASVDKVFLQLLVANKIALSSTIHALAKS